MSEVVAEFPKTLIVSDNMVEAEDLIEMLTPEGLGPVALARDVGKARFVVEQSRQSLHLIIFGLSMHIHESSRFVETLDRSGTALLVLDGPVSLGVGEGAGCLNRPFSTNDVMAALARLKMSG